MSVTFELIDVIILIGICQGVFLSMTLLRLPNHNKEANRILAALIFISTLMLIGRFMMIRLFSKEVFLWALLFDVIIFVFGPLFYSYTRRLLMKEDRWRSKLKYHYIPALIYFLVAIYYLVHYDSTSYYNAFREGSLTLFFTLVLSLAILSNILYLFLSFTVVNEFKKRRKHHFSFQQSPVAYLTVFLCVISVIMGVWLLAFLDIKSLSPWLSFFNYDVVWAIIPVFIYVIGYFSLKQPHLFRVSEVKEKQLVKPRLSEKESSILKEKLDSLMENDKVFLQSDLTLKDVAQKISASTNNVSWLLNKIYCMTFYDFVNSYRVQEFVRKVENNEHLQHTILALSMDVGFNSKSTFNKAFKLTMKDTPSNYIKKHRAA
ncbi:MAG: AraC family transcriptional regulator [Bacteroidetes bacterium]|nr:AraC family transcriptional regulator [Bacteroidota bacterium]